MTTTGLPDWMPSVAYSQWIQASGGTGIYTFSATGSLPPGLTLSSSGLLSGTPTATGAYSFTVTVRDSTGANASQAYSLHIGTPPVFSGYLVKVVGSTTTQAGNSVLASVQAADQFGNPLLNYRGPSTAAVSVSPTTVATIPSTASINSSGLGLFLASFQAVGTYTFTVSSGSLSGSSSAVTVTPGPAVKLAFAQQPASMATGVALAPVTVQVEDRYGNVVASDNTDVVTAGIASGPAGAPGFTAASTLSTPVHNGVATFSNLTLVTPGSYTLSAQVPTRYTGPNSATFQVTPLQVEADSFTSTPWGFSLRFNAPYLVNSLTPVLYGAGSGAAAPAPSVTLTQTHNAYGNLVDNAVEGSLVLDAANDGLTFVATDTANEANYNSPLLAPGQYTVVIRGTAAGNGFQALNAGGGFLDGLGTGVSGSGDFTTTFTVDAATIYQDVVWAPATADGPKQTLQAPGTNLSGGGYPIYLDDYSKRVTGVLLTFNYNPAMLTLEGAAANPALPGSSFVLNAALSTPGHAVLQYADSGANITNLIGGQVPLGFLNALVPDSSGAAPVYKGKDLLTLTDVAIDGGSILAQGSAALHVVSFVGDADGDGGYNSADAAAITRVGLQLDSGFPAYPLVDPVIVADTDGGGFLPADAALQVNEVGVNSPTTTVPAPPTPVDVTPVGNNVDPSLSLSAGRPAGTAGVLQVAVLLDDPHPAGSSGLIRGHLALTYDARAFTVSAADVHPGSLLAGSSWSVAPTIDQASGQIAIALSGSTPIDSTTGGSLVVIDFHPLPGQPADAAGSPVLVSLAASVNPSGSQEIWTELQDAQGAFTLTWDSSPVDLLA